MPVSSRHRGPRCPRLWKPGLLLICGLALQLPAQQAGAQSAQGGLQSGAEQAARAACEKDFKPSTGQPGKDVVWVPTSQELVEKMLDLAQVRAGERLMDLGSGDGRTVIAAARRGLVAQGVEYNPEMAELARRNAAKAGVAERATFITGDLFEADLSQADVITMFLLPSINEKLRPRLLELEPGTRVVSNTFRMGDWQPDATDSVDGDCQNWCMALLWIVPAKVEGTWRLDGQELKLAQRYQMLEGTLAGTPISDARLRGNEITFTAGGVRYAGTVQGRTMQGTTTGARNGTWSARRG